MTQTELKNFKCNNSLNPFEKEGLFATSILSESINLQFDREGRILITEKLLRHAKIKKNMLFVGQEEPSKYGNQQILKNLGSLLKKNLT